MYLGTQKSGVKQLTFTWIGWRDEGGHSEHSCHPQTNAGGCGAPVQPEWDPGYDDNKAGWYVDLDQVIAHGPHELDLARETGVVTCNKKGGIKCFVKI